MTLSDDCTKVARCDKAKRCCARTMQKQTSVPLAPRDSASFAVKSAYFPAPETYNAVPRARFRIVVLGAA